MNTPVLRSGLRSKEQLSGDFQYRTEGVPQNARLLPGMIVAHKYLIRGVLGEGGFAVVYEAEHLALHCLMAIKVLHVAQDTREEVVVRFREEGRISAAIHHINVLGIHDAGTLEDGSPYLVMERVDGDTLHARLKRGVLPVHEVLDLARQLLLALAALHELGIVHRDIKPENLMFHRSPTGERVVKLVDFGISKVLRPGERRTLGKGLVGTPHYMSPEHLTGEDVDSQADLYATGVVLYEALTGRLPHECETLSSLAFSVIMGNVTPVRSLRFDCPPELERIVLRAIEPDKRVRYATPLAMLRDVEACARSLSEPSFMVDLSVASQHEQMRQQTPTQGKTKSWDVRDLRDLTHPTQTRASSRTRTALAIALGVSSILVMTLGFEVSRGPKPSAQHGPAGATPVQPSIAYAAAPIVSRVSTHRVQPSLAAITTTANRDFEPSLIRGRSVVRGESDSEVLREPRRRRKEPEERLELSETGAAPVSRMSEGRAAQGLEQGRDRLREAALASYLRGRLRQSLELYRSATSLDPKDANAWRGVGVVAARLGRHTDARKAFERYLALSPQSQDAAAIRQRMLDLPSATEGQKN